MSKKKAVTITVLLSLIIAVVGVMCFANFDIPGTIKRYNSVLSQVGKGIDLAGGYYVVLEPKNENGAEDRKIIDDASTILRERLDKKGYTEALITPQDGDKIRVEIPQIEDGGEVLEIIGQTGKLTFRDTANHELLNGEDHIKSAYVAQDKQSGGFLVIMNFTDAGMTKFAAATEAISKKPNEADRRMGIWLGDTEVSSPTVKEAINSPSAQIEGYKTYEDALSIASVIDSGKLPIEYSVSESNSISSRLGEGAIQSSAVMGAVGLAIIFLIMIIRYRGLGVAASVALVIYVLLYVIFLAIIPSVQLTLPGIAGILLSIGMAVDSNIIIFERIREEYAIGKTADASVEQGFKRAVITVFDSNITTIFAAVILLILASGAIKGFAITLLIGIVLTLVTAIFVTRWLIKLFTSLAKNQEKFLCLKRAGGEN